MKQKLSKIIKQLNKENAPPDGWKPEDRVLEIEKIKKEADELMIKKIKHYEKEMALVREQAQIDILNLEKRIPELVQRINDLVKVNEAHQKLNGELREDNKKLAQHVDDLLSRLDKLRHLGVI